MGADLIIETTAEVAQVVEHGTENAGVDSSSLSLGTTYFFSRDSTTINPKYLRRACYFAGELPTFSGSNNISVCVHCYAEIQPTLLRFPLTSTTRVQNSFT